MYMEICWGGGGIGCGFAKSRAGNKLSNVGTFDSNSDVLKVINLH